MCDKGKRVAVDSRVPGRCSRCMQSLHINPENGLCLVCENIFLREELAQKDLLLSASRRERQTLYERLSRERSLHYAH